MGLNENTENIEELCNELTKIIKKPFNSEENNDDKCCDVGR